ncbi:hypothetical protein [Dubosiella muris]|uniref:Uncharacterized protein n=2 Tax=Dubosiella TaxID=1937008 RepID=A0AC61R5W9_9FIRM|nr:hypothetical protein [Dubosiella muris]TGY65255.1 hypothetical protein E5336_09495 [Dubosiella muris]
MKEKEKFPYEIEEGAVMDYVENRFMLVLKDKEWTEEELGMLDPLRIGFCYTNGLAIFVLEGGDIDSSDFYFNIQECDWKDALLNADQVTVEVVLVDQHNDICWKRSKSFTKKDSLMIQETLKKQAEIEFMPGEYDVNISGMQSAYEPFELLKFEQCFMEM